MSAPRTHIKGLDKPTASALSASTDPELKIFLQAVQHERNRLHSVAELMVLVGLLVSKRFLFANEVVTVGGAFFQFGDGIGADQTVAAHCLPGQVAFNSIMLHNLVEWTEKRLRDAGFKPIPLAAKLRNLCGRCDVVDVQVNAVDSFLEKAAGGRGLKPGLGRAVHRLLSSVNNYRADVQTDLLGVIHKEFNLYHSEAGYLCLERQEWLSNQLVQTMSKEDARKHRLKNVVLEAYIQVLSDTRFVPDALSVAGYQQTLNDVLVH